jgi:hypothetical protein
MQLFARCRYNSFVQKSSDTESLSPVCLNCGAEVTSRFCGECGQENEPPTPGFRSVLADLWQEFLQVDGKILKTLWYLLSRPGFLSAEYVAGKRITYVSPFKLYFWTTALFVLFVLRLNIIDSEKLQLAADKVKIEEIKESPTPKPGSSPTPKPKTSEKNEVFNINVLDKERRIVLPKGNDLEEQTIAAALRFAVPNLSSAAMRLMLGENIDPDKLPRTVTAYRDAQAKLKTERQDSPKRRFLSERLIRLRNNPWEGLKSIVAAGIPNVLIFCVPFWALIIKLFFPKRVYIEHLIFALHTHVFGVLCLALSVGAWQLLPTIKEFYNGILLLIPIYNFIAARRFYAQHPAWLLVKGGGLSCAYGCILLVAAIFGLIFTLVWTLVSG